MNFNINTKSKRKRINYLDSLRVCAIICVIAVHIYAIFLDKFILGEAHFHSTFWFISTFLGVSLRIGVCLFLTLAGALSLGREWKISEFLGKRIPRIVMPFLFWGFVCATIITVLYFAPSPYSIPFEGNNLPQSPLNLKNYLSFLFSYYMAEAYSSIPYWFFWMILGTYLIMPIFNKWILHSNLNELEYYLILWLVSCIFDYTVDYTFPIKLTYFVSPMGLVVLGYYLRHTKRKIFNNPYFGLFLTISMIIIEMSISYVYSTPSNVVIFGRYSFLIALEVIGVFLLFKNFNKFNLNLKFIKNPKSLYRRIVLSISRCSYGMYLVHLVVLRIIWYELILPNNIFLTHSSITIIIALILTVFISWQIINLLSRIPKLSKIVGAK